MYALARNAQKYADRDQRIQRSQLLEFDYLAPDTINEMADAIAFLEQLTVTDKGESSVKGWENSNRIALLIKVPQAIAMYKKMITTHLASVCMDFIQMNKNSDFAALKKALGNGKMRSIWVNVGGQLILETEIEKLKTQIRDSKIKSWDKVHLFYQKQADQYAQDKAKQAWAAYVEVFKL
jgi:hypothetical protein